MSIAQFESPMSTPSISFAHFDSMTNMQAPYKNKYLEGVNYGNRFIPEPDMSTDAESIFGTKYGPKVYKPDNIDEYSFCDVEDDRILRYLDDKILEDDFKKMSDWGVKLVRVPTGYWNWIDLGWEVTPHAPQRVQ